MFNIFLFSGLLMSAVIGNGKMTYIQNLECSSSYFQVTTENEIYNGENLFTLTGLNLIINYDLTTTLRRGDANLTYNETTNGVLNIDMSSVVNDIYIFCETYGGMELLKNQYYFYMVFDYITFNVSPSRSYGDSSTYARMTTEIDINFEIGLSYGDYSTLVQYSGLELIYQYFNKSFSTSSGYSGAISTQYAYNSVTYNNNNELNYYMYSYGLGNANENAYQNGYDIGYEQGYGIGFQGGVNSTPGGVIELIKKPFDAIANLLGTEIAPNFNIGMLLTIPIVIGVLWFVLKALIN